MSDTPPPPYPDRDLYETLAESTSYELTSEKLAKVREALAKAADLNPNNIERTFKEINALIKEGVDLGNRLQVVHNLVIKAGLESKGTVKKLRDDYIDLLWRSREIAGKALGAVKEFNGDLLELLADPNETPQSKMTDLTETWNVIKSKGAEAQKQPNEFKDLLESLSECSEKVQKDIATEDSMEKAQILTVHKEVRDLEVAIDKLQNSIVKPLAKTLKLMKGVFKSLLSGSPTTAFDNLIEAVVNSISELGKYKEILKNKSRERFELQQKLEVKRDELRILEMQQVIIGNVSIVPGLVTSIRDDIAAFATTLMPFIGVFDQLQDEYDGFVLLLKSNTPVTDPVFRSRVQLIKSLSPRIVSALELYSKAQIHSV